MIDLITDFDNIVNEQLIGIVEYCKEQFNLEEVDKDTKSHIRTLIKSYVIIGIWYKKLPTINNLFIMDILGNLCSILHMIILKDVKGLNFFSRNTIENFLRYMTKDLTSKNIDGLFAFKNYEIWSENKKYDSQLNISLEILKHKYSELCKYVHSDTSIMTFEKACLTQYSNNNTDLSKHIKTLKQIMEQINIILFVIYQDKYNSLKTNAKTLIIDYIPNEYKNQLGIRI